MDLTEDGEMGEKEGTLKARPGKGGTSGGMRRCDGTEQYDPDPQGCSSSIDPLVAVLCEAFMEGSPQCSSKKKQKTRPFGRIGTDDDVDTDSEDEEVKPRVKFLLPYSRDFQEKDQMLTY